jgi:uroporphyrinogen decarboxylase
MTVSANPHRARLEACLAGETPDRPPIALWRHFPVDDQSPDGLAAATANFQNSYDFDLIKVTPTSSFCIKDWGVEDRWAGNPEGTREYTRRVIQRPEDWARLSLLDPTAGKLGEQITCLRLITKEFSPRVPVIQTIFSPMAQAKNLAGAERLLIDLRRSPEALHAGLKRITEVTLRFLDEAIRTGIDGVFYAIQYGQYSLLSEAEFDEFCAPYDRQVLEAAQSLWLRMLHLHGSDIMFAKASSYPVNLLNWHDRETAPSLEQAQQQFAGAVCGGLRQWDTMVLGTPGQVRAEAEDAIRQTGGKRFLLGTGCVLPTTAPYGNIRAAREAVDRM